MAQPKTRAKAKAKEKTTKGVEKPKPKAKTKASPKSEAKPKRKSRRTPAGPAGGDEVEPEEIPPAGEVPHEPAVMMSELTSLENELIFQFKSGKTLLKGSDFPVKNFSKTSVSAYYTRARPTVGLKTKIKTTRTNKEFCHFSFSIKDVLNIGLAMRCALLTTFWIDQQDDDLDPWSSTVQNYVENMKVTAQAAIASVKEKIDAHPELTERQRS